MRTRTWLSTAALVLTLPASFFSTACGDSTNPTGGGGEGGGTGGEGTGGTIVSGNDTCESATAVSVGQDEQTFVQGSMEGAADDYPAFCGDSETQPNLSYPEVVFAVTVEEACTASFTLEGDAGFDGILALATAECGYDDY